MNRYNPPRESCLFQFAKTQVGHAAQQHQNRRKRSPQHRADLHLQTAQQRQKLIPCRPVIQEIIQPRKQRIILNMPADEQIDAPRERIGDRPREFRNHQQRNQCQNARRQIHTAGRQAQRRARHIQRLSARRKQQNQ